MSLRKQLRPSGLHNAMRREQLIARDRCNRVVVVRTHAEHAQGFLADDPGRLDIEMELRATTLRNPAAKQAASCWSSTQVADAEPSCRFSGDRDAAWVAAEGP